MKSGVVALLFSAIFASASYFASIYSLFAQEEVGENGDRIWLKGGINFMDADSTMMLTLRFRMQNQASLETVSESDLGIRDAQFTIRRVRLRLNGFVVDPRLTYLLQLGFTRGDADFDNTQFFNVLRDAMIVYRVQPNLHLGFGLGKLPGNRERVISSSEQQFVDRSLVNRTFNLDRDVGLNFYYSQPFGAPTHETPRASIRAALTTGEGRNPLRTIQGLATTVRVSVFPFGSFANNGDYFVSDLAHEESPKLYVAGVFSRNENAGRTGGTIGLPLYEARSMENWFADAIFKWRGFSFYGEYARRTAQNPVTRDGTSIRAVFVGEGLNLQAGYFLVPAKWEVSARYSAIHPNASVEAYLQGQTQYTACLSYFLNGHRVKVQTDFTYNVVRDVRLPSEQRSWIVRGQVELGL